jgi:hypothetical protein
VRKILIVTAARAFIQYVDIFIMHSRIKQNMAVDTHKVAKVFSFNAGSRNHKSVCRLLTEGASDRIIQIP